jgi:hypothetical protein
VRLQPRLFPAIFAAEHFDNKVRADFFAGIAGDPAARNAGCPPPKTRSRTIRIFAAEAKSWHGSGLLVMSRDEFKKGGIVAGTE